MNKTYIDSRGYLRFNNSHRLVHRWVAEKQIYEKDKNNYPLPFEDYQIHHIDGNKLNNDAGNLKITTRWEHEKYHKMERSEWDLIRILIVLLILFGGIVPWLGFFARSFNWSIELSLVIFLIIYIFSLLIIKFLTRERSGIKKIY